MRRVVWAFVARICNKSQRRLRVYVYGMNVSCKGLLIGLWRDCLFSFGSIFWVHDNSSKTISPIRQLVAYDIWSMRHFAKYDIWSKKIVRYDIRSKLSSHCFSTKRRTQRNVASTKCYWLLKRGNHKKSLCLSDVQLIKTRSIYIKLLQS